MGRGHSVFALAALAFTAQSTPVSIWPSNPTPAAIDLNDGQALELGVRFRSDVAGQVTAIRFYKGPLATGTHVGNLWSSTGTNLGTVTFTGETASGWQQMSFAAPVAITAGTTYVASYFASDGYYPATNNGFATAVDSPPLHALQDGAAEPNGLYLYTATSAFPTQTYQASNYWVDVVFVPGTAGTPTTPPVTPTTPPTGLVSAGGGPYGVGEACGCGSIGGSEVSFTALGSLLALAFLRCRRRS